MREEDSRGALTKHYVVELIHGFRSNALNLRALQMLDKVKRRASELGDKLSNQMASGLGD